MSSVFSRAAKGPISRFHQFLRRSDIVSFDSIIGQAAILEPSGRIYAVNEAWNRIQLGQRSDRRIGSGDNYLSVLRGMAVKGDDYAQAELLGISSVLNGLVPAFSLRYPADTIRGLRWFEVTVTPIAQADVRWAIMVIREDHDQQTVTGDGGVPRTPHSIQLLQIADALVEMTALDCALIFGSRWNASPECSVLAQSSNLPIKARSEHARVGSPCGDSSQGGFLFCDSGIQRRYPNAEWLRDLGANGFADIAVQQPDGEFLGHISVLHHSALKDAASIEASLRLFAARTLMELERLPLRDDRRQSNDRAALAESRYSAVFQNASDAILVMDPETVTVDANEAAAALFGRPSYALIGMTAADLIGPGPSSDILAKGRWGGDLTIDHRDGTRVDVEVSVTSMNALGKRNFVMIGRDIGHRKADESKERQQLMGLQEERLKREAILRAIPDAVFVVNRDGDFLEAQTELDGDGSDRLTVARSIEDLLSESDLIRGRAAIADSIDASRHVVVEFGTEIDGEKRIYEWRFSPYLRNLAILLIRDCTALYRQPARESTKAGAKLIEGKFPPPQIFRRNRYGLTFRELTVLNLLAAGTTDKEIADKLCLSIYTVNKHVANILGKMQATSRTEAAVRAAREGLATISA